MDGNEFSSGWGWVWRVGGLGVEDIISIPGQLVS